MALLRELPISFVPLLLRELIAYDWKFPAERKELDQQFAYLESRSAAERRQLMEGFEKLRLSPELERVDWVNAPVQFSEQLTTHLWATHQIDAFRAAAVDYMKKVHAAAPHEPLPMPRLAPGGGGPGSGGKPIPAVSQAAAARSLLQPCETERRIPHLAGRRSRESEGPSRSVRPLVYQWGNRGRHSRPA